VPFLPYFIRFLAYFSTYVCILRKIQALYGCIRIPLDVANIYNIRYGYGIFMIEYTGMYYGPNPNQVRTESSTFKVLDRVPRYSMDVSKCTHVKIITAYKSLNRSYIPLFF
jgi:hypothetical protein